MTFPTLLSPWYVVVRVVLEGEKFTQVYWTSDNDEQNPWTTNPHQAMLFMNLSSAARIADPSDGFVQVVYSKEGLREYRPREFSDVPTSFTERK